jgi:hypothetical protein
MRLRDAIEIRAPLYAAAIGLPNIVEKDSPG